MDKRPPHFPTKRFKTAGLALAMSLMVIINLPAVSYQIDMNDTTWELAPGLTTRVWSYNGTVPGFMITAQPGQTVVIQGTNHLPVATNIHWHGLSVPNDQDGVMREIKPGETYRYEFVVPESGTYLYHSHYRPVLDQMDMGLYGAFIVTAPEDAAYSSDNTFVLDDWFLDVRGRRLNGTDRGEMERLGNVETVNGKTGAAIPPLLVKNGQLLKLRFINASTAAVHTLKVTGHTFRVTHLDGHALSEPYLTDTLTLNPTERIDAELEAIGKVGENYTISSSRPDYGMVIPIKYEPGSVAKVPSPFVPPKAHGYPGIEAKAPDFVLDLNSRMNMSMHSGGGEMGMDSGSMMQWTINGKSWPNTDPLNVKLGSVVKIRLYNNDTKNMHPMDHPIHLHGTYFQVVSINGRKPPREMWKDTAAVPAGQFVDIAFRYANPGDWMLHCHIVDHEDNGMMTIVRVK